MNEFQQVFLPVFGGGCVAASLCALCAARLSSRWAAGLLLVLGALVAWFALIAGTHYGYGAWQQIDNPPEEAYADGANLTGSVLFGWLPAGALSVVVFRLARMRRGRALPPPLPPHSASS